MADGGGLGVHAREESGGFYCRLEAVEAFLARQGCGGCGVAGV
jgi:hypothetical protein